ncbi:unnamed protein product [Closterium sp. NIES-65]|nr:unnamed protein product [Closterium sp. NIES-65]
MVQDVLSRVLCLPGGKIFAALDHPAPGCQQAGVWYVEEEVESIEDNARSSNEVCINSTATIYLCQQAGVRYVEKEVESMDDDARSSSVACTDGSIINSRLVVVAAGAASGKFLKYDNDTRGVGVQTAYGIEVELDSAYPYNPASMLFMDYRDLQRSREELAAEGELSQRPSFLYAMPSTPTRVFFQAEERVLPQRPSFLYAMPSTPTWVFFQETCLASRPAMPFDMPPVPPFSPFLSVLRHLFSPLPRPTPLWVTGDVPGVPPCNAETCLASRPAMPFDMLKTRLRSRLAQLGVIYTVTHEEVRAVSDRPLQSDCLIVVLRSCSDCSRLAQLGVKYTVTHEEVRAVIGIPLEWAALSLTPRSSTWAFPIPAYHAPALPHPYFPSPLRPTYQEWSYIPFETSQKFSPSPHLPGVEWSYIPVGGSLPLTTQQHLGFGAAASMIHPATGYSITRSLTEAPHYATALAAALRSPSRTSLEAATQAWDHLWSAERKRQQSFMIFGLELILQLDAPATRDFFNAFFKLPPSYPSRPFPTTLLLPSPFSALLCSSPTLSTHLHPSPPLRLWRGFLASNLSSLDLLLLAFSTFLVASNPLRSALSTI